MARARRVVLVGLGTIKVLFVLLGLFPTIFASERVAPEYCEVMFGNLYRGASYVGRAYTGEFSPKSVPRPLPLRSDSEITTIDIFSAMPLSNLRNRPETPITASEFKNLFPHNLDDLAEGQTKVLLTEKNTRLPGEYLLKGYDPAFDQVILERETRKIIQASPLFKLDGMDSPVDFLKLLREDKPRIRVEGKDYEIVKSESTSSHLVAKELNPNLVGGTARKFPVMLSDQVYIENGKTLFSEIKIGDLIEQEGEKFEIIAKDRLSRKVILRRAQQVRMSLEDFLAISTSPEKIAILPPSGLLPNKKSPLLSSFLHSAQLKNIKLVGKKGRKRISQRRFISGDFLATKKEVDIKNILSKISAYPSGTKVKVKINGEANEYTANDLKYLKSPNFDVKNLEEIIVEVPARAIEIYRREFIKVNGVNLPKFFNESPVMAREIVYEVNGASGTHNIIVRFPEKSGWKNRKAENLADEFVAHLPYLHSEANTLFLLEGNDYYLGKGASALAHQPVQSELGDQVRTISMLKYSMSAHFLKERALFLWHEMGHQVASKLWQKGHNAEVEWARAAALDRRVVSGYAMRQYPEFSSSNFDLAEDFAETVTAYVLSDAGRLNPKLREAFANRFAVLDRIFL